MVTAIQKARIVQRSDHTSDNREAIASGINAKATTIPDNTSPLTLENQSFLSFETKYHSSTPLSFDFLHKKISRLHESYYITSRRFLLCKSFLKKRRYISSVFAHSLMSTVSLTTFLNNF